jgi:hypothetical protein
MMGRRPFTVETCERSCLIRFGPYLETAFQMTASPIIRLRPGLPIGMTFAAPLRGSARQAAVE